MTKPVLIATAIWIGGAISGSGADHRPVAFENVNVVPMDRERVIERQTVIVRDGRIAQIGPAAKVKAPAEALRVPGNGKYLMPGLAEMHGHLPSANTPREMVDTVLFLYVANGVTTLRGMLGDASNLETRDRIARGEQLGPTMYVAGPGFSGGAVPTVEVARRMVQEQKKAGYDHLKIQEGLKPEVYDAIVAAANEAKISFAGHVPNDVGVRRAIEARQKSIDHLDNYIEALEADNSPVRNVDAQTRSRELVFNIDEGKMAALARATRETGVWNVPTMALWETFFSDEPVESLRNRAEMKYAPAQWLDPWSQRKSALLKEPTNVMGFETTARVGARVIELRKKILRALHQAGCKIALGTDSPQVFSVPGFSIYREMPIMVASGFTPYQVLESGTKNVAEYFGTTAETGTVEAGKRADLILLEANPLKDVGNVARRAGVMVRGRWLPEAEIQTGLAKIAVR